MRVLSPVRITDAMLIAHNVPEPDTGDPAAWVGSTTYATGALVYRASTHRIYRRMPNQIGASTVAPELDTAGWEELRATNRWAVFDDVVNSQTTRASPLDVTIAPGVVQALALLGLEGSSVTVTMTDGAGGPTVYSRTVSLSLSVVADWYGHFFEPFRQRTSVVLVDLPPYANGRIRVQLTGSGTVRCGALLAGPLYTLGGTQYGATAGIRDYSRKEVDAATGLVTLEQRRFAKTLRGRLALPTAGVDAAHTVLTELRGRLAVWLGDNGSGIEPLQVYGWWKDFSLDLAGPGLSYYTLDIEGIT